MTAQRAEVDMASYAEVALSELSEHRADLPSIALLVGLTLLAGGAFVLVGGSDSLTTSYLFLLAGMICLVCVCEVVGRSRQCRHCHSPLTSYANANCPDDLVREYFEVCESCGRFSRYSQWDLA